MGGDWDVGSATARPDTDVPVSRTAPDETGVVEILPGEPPPRGSVGGTERLRTS
jgi:hypothetical protein